MPGAKVKDGLSPLKTPSPERAFSPNFQGAAKKKTNRPEPSAQAGTHRAYDAVANEPATAERSFLSNALARNSQLLIVPSGFPSDSAISLTSI